MTDTSNLRIDEIEKRLLEALIPYQRAGAFDEIMTALEHVISFQMALACPECRRHIARRLRADLPAMLNAADQLAREARAQNGEQHHHSH
jgi:hypothetical protein